MGYDNSFLKILHEKRTACSSSASRYVPVLSPVMPVSGTPFYECMAFEDYSVNFPYFVEMSALRSYYLIYTSGGGGKLTYRDASALLTPGTVALIDCAFPVRLEIYDNASWSFRALYLSGPSMFNYFAAFSRSGKYACRISPVSKIPAIIDSISDMMRSRPMIDYEIIMSRDITDLLTAAIHAMDVESSAVNSIPRYILDIKRELDSNFSSSFTLDELAAFTSMSKFQLSHDFTRYFHIAPMKYLNTVRLENAKKLLTSTDMSVSEVGSSVGIENTTHFINMFKRSFGTTPNQYRRFTPESR